MSEQAVDWIQLASQLNNPCQRTKIRAGFSNVLWQLICVLINRLLMPCCAYILAFNACHMDL